MADNIKLQAQTAKLDPGSAAPAGKITGAHVNEKGQLTAGAKQSHKIEEEPLKDQAAGEGTKKCNKPKQGHVEADGAPKTPFRGIPGIPKLATPAPKRGGATTGGPLNAGTATTGQPAMQAKVVDQGFQGTPQTPKSDIHFDVYKEGPHFAGTARMDQFNDWKSLIDEKRKTPSEKNVLLAMSSVEGNMDAINAYDSAIVSLGSMQKIANGAGTGELSNQVFEFSQSNPADYKRLFADKGWTAEKKTVPVINKKTKKPAVDKQGKPVTKTTGPFLFYTDPDTGKKMTGSELRNYLRHKEKLTPSELADAKANKQNVKNLEREKTRAFARRSLGPLVEAGRDPAFQKKQVIDFNTRLKNALNQKPSGYDYSIGKYATSELGGALVLDQSVNRPGHVHGDFGQALDKFFKAHASDQPPPDHDPSKWPAAQRAQYEKEILNYYAGNPSVKGDAGTRANHKSGGMTDPILRRDKIRNYSLGHDPTSKKDIHLSTSPGSLTFPPDPPKPPKNAASGAVKK